MTEPVSRPRGVTVYEVAHAAGVSIATVSRVLRGTVPVSEEKRARVLRAVEEMNYLPSHLGRSLAEGRHAANGVVFPDLSGPYYAEVVLGYEEVASELGRSVLILSTHGRSGVRDMVRDLAARVDGLVVFGRTVGDDVVAELVESGLPVVLLARDPVPGADAIRTENVEAARALAGHLVGHGYRRVTFLGDAASSPDVAERWTGLSRGLRAHGVRPAPPLACAFDEQAGAEAARAALARRSAPQALVCANDEIALGALLVAEELGLRVPDDVAITGWDDVMAARFARPALTTVRQPMRELGALAARTLDRRINGDRSEPLTELLPTELVVRASCGRHRTKEER